MAPRIYVDVTAEEMAELSQELARIVDLARVCADLIARSGEPYRADGFSNAIDGMESLTKMLGGVIGPYNATPPKLESIRAKIKLWRDSREVATTIESAGVSTKARLTASKTPKSLPKLTAKPGSQPPKKGRK